MDLQLNIFAPEGHAHAARAAAAAGELGGGHDEKVQALLVQHVVGDGVAGVDADLAGLDAQGVGAVVPLLALGRDAVAYAFSRRPVVFCDRLGGLRPSFKRVAGRARF